MGILDNTQRKAKITDPREVIIYSLPKVGKTKLALTCPKNYLLVDFENGADYYEGNIININSHKELIEVFKELAKTKAHYDVIFLDTLTSLYENLCNQVAVTMYNKDNNKSEDLNWDITMLAYGLGQKYMRAALQKIKDTFKKFCDTLIIFGHAADKAMDGSDGSSLTIQELAIDGKLKHIIALKTDALGLLYRDEEGVNKLSFATASGLIGGTRVPHLANKDFVFSEQDEDGNLTVHWDQFFTK